MLHPVLIFIPDGPQIFSRHLAAVFGPPLPLVFMHVYWVQSVASVRAGFQSRESASD